MIAAGTSTDAFSPVRLQVVSDGVEGERARNSHGCHNLCRVSGLPYFIAFQNIDTSGDAIKL